MAIEPEFVRWIKRWVRPVNSKEHQQDQTQASTYSGKPMQLDDDDNDLR
jgi:hypothetical protein